MSITQHTPSVAVPSARTPADVLPPCSLRLRIRTEPLATSAHVTGMVDGGWWPRSYDLVTELEPLLVEMAGRGHIVHRVSYSLRGWPSVPRKLHLAGTLVRLGGYRTQSPAVIHLITSSGRPPLVLVVVPPTTPPVAAARALHLAVTDTALDAEAILTAATA